MGKLAKPYLLAKRRMNQPVQGSFASNWVTFDGVNDYLDLNSAMTGHADSDELLFYARVDLSSLTDNTAYTIIGPQNTVVFAKSIFEVSRNTLNKWLVIAWHDTPGPIFNDNSVNAYTASAGIVNILVAASKTQNKVQMYVDEVQEVNTTLDTTSYQFNWDGVETWNVGALGASHVNKWKGNMAHVWLATGSDVYRDLTSVANRRLFYNTDLSPVGPLLTVNGITPVVNFGGNSRAHDDVTGDGSKGWNDGYNWGSGDNWTMVGEV